MNAEDKARLHLIIGGRVQGVFFRGATADQAVALGLKGWVRNLPDRQRVEVMLEGSRRNLEMMLAWSHQGPPSARVDEVTAEWSQFTGEFASFAIR